ncbi:MAG: hypothetical protein EOP45_09420 [Sphingobacteriaceae bacterium]|nr:MAG: hypothetical protein EOP45_09420 [Sphingobacteriaceae bacterium]
MNTSTTRLVNTASYDTLINRTYYDSFQNGNELFSNSVSLNNNVIIADLKRKIVFKNELIFDKLISNAELLECLSDTLKLISANGVAFHADIDFTIEDDGDPNKLLLVYYPIVLKENNNIYIQKELSDKPVNRLYRNLIRNLYKYSISIRKSVVIDEQFI